MRLIDGDALVKKFSEAMPEYLSGTHAQREAIKLISSMPTIEPRRGELISAGYDELYCDFGNCTLCGADQPTHNKFCRNCGAEMSGADMGREGKG